MKSWMAIPFALIAGWMLGAWVPKAELRTTREELTQARKALKTRGAPRGGGFDGVTRMLGIEGTGGREVSEKPNDGEGDGDAGGEPAAGSEDLEDGAVVAVAGDGGGGEGSELPDAGPSSETGADADGESIKQGIEEAMEAWEARADIARSTFVVNAGLSAEEAARFDVLMAAMNIRLGHTIESFAEGLEGEEDMTEEKGVKLMRDLTTSVAGTYDELDASMPEGWRGDAGKDFSLTAFVDPTVALPLVDVEEKLESFEGPEP